MADYARSRGADLRKLLVETFEHYEVPAKDVEVTAEALVHADEMGIDSHGVGQTACRCIPMSSHRSSGWPTRRAFRCPRRSDWGGAASRACVCATGFVSCTRRSGGTA